MAKANAAEFVPSVFEISGALNIAGHKMIKKVANCHQFPMMARTMIEGRLSVALHNDNARMVNGVAFEWARVSDARVINRSSLSDIIEFPRFNFIGNVVQ